MLNNGSTEAKKITIRFNETDISYGAVNITTVSDLRSHIKITATQHVFLLCTNKYVELSETNFDLFKAAGQPIILKISESGVTPTTTPERKRNTIDYTHMKEDLQTMLHEETFPLYNMPVTFKACGTLQRVSQFITADGSNFDKHICFVMAPPGAGKTSTVGLACKRSEGTKLVRYRLSYHNTTALTGTFTSIDMTKLVNTDDCVRVIEPYFKNIFTSSLNNVDKAHKSGYKVVVFHVDEIQTVFGTTIIKKSASFSGNLMDYALLALCNVLIKYMRDREWLKVVLTGTNFFASYALNIGSEMKHVVFPMDGFFPLDWLFNSVVIPYFQCFCNFDLTSKQEDIESLLYYVSVNRRVTQNSLKELHDMLRSTGEKVDWNSFKDCLVKATDEMYNKWKMSITNCLNSNLPSEAIQCFNFLMFPEQYNCTEIKPHSVVYSKDQGIDKLINYARGGAMYCNIIQKTGSVTELYEFQKPRGVYELFLLDSARGLSRKVLDEIKAFHDASKSNYMDKGHLFERALCGELELPYSPIHKLIAERTSRNLQYNVKVREKTLNYNPTIHTINDNDYFDRVHCVCEDPKFKGQIRIVDVGYSLYDVTNKCYVKVFFECKDVESETVVQRQALQYFEHEEFKNQNVILVFLSKKKFMDYCPRNKATTSGKKNAIDSKNAISTLLNNSSIVVLEGSDLDDCVILNDSTLVAYY